MSSEAVWITFSGLLASGCLMLTGAMAAGGLLLYTYDDWSIHWERYRRQPLGYHEMLKVKTRLALKHARRRARSWCGRLDVRRRMPLPDAAETCAAASCACAVDGAAHCDADDSDDDVWD